MLSVSPSPSAQGDSKSIDLFQASVATFLDFLHHIYVSGRCYSTVNSYQSVVSVTIEQLLVIPWVLTG